MISHQHKCIFIHIPRTGGTSVEQLIFGGNWWAYEKETKHLLASQAKKLYADYWDDYFKFAFVRNPFDRVVSLLNFSSMYYGTSISDRLTQEHIEWYKKKYGYPKVVEYDYRFYKRSEVICENHAAGQVYGNIIDEELDFIGKFESLEDDFRKVCDFLKINYKTLPHKAQSKHREHYRSYFDEGLVDTVEKLYANDLKKFNYSF
ncbi:hypothetical protein EHN06_13685 [Marinobacter sp. NP-4(2019)]|uniref:sulfotransferase family 2 domain-containing protein n=1 Tax=Marinobacter sp. NP-4(2019) TaxID=2488665 RepID=UPI000FC3ED22|nr:sulfotransferase family 2 domain-containing protein [Marinobacter sp. NP-4(2019)]AZT84506.1 hypothetical protein EHN06_13685 [Marinobacter sp. NP-4(2019)]